MKNILLIIFIVFSSNTIIAQNLSFSELKQLQKKPIEDLNDYLVERDWILKKMEEKGSIEDFDGHQWITYIATWNGSQDPTWLDYKKYSEYEINAEKNDYTKSIEKVLLAYFTHDRIVYKSIKESLEREGFVKKEINSGTADDKKLAGIQTVYENEKYTVGMTSMTLEGKPIFAIHITNKLDLKKL